MKQTYFVRVNRREPVSGVIFDVVCEIDNATKDDVLRVFRENPLSKSISWQLWDNVINRWIDARRFALEYGLECL